MQKILVTLGAIAALGFLAYRTLYKIDSTENVVKTDTELRNNGEVSAPKQQLDNVRGAAKRIEAGDQAYTDKMAEETKSP
jgi:hypothetical protein